MHNAPPRYNTPNTPPQPQCRLTPQTPHLPEAAEAEDLEAEAEVAAEAAAAAVPHRPTPQVQPTLSGSVGRALKLLRRSKGAGLAADGEVEAEAVSL